MSIKRLFFVGGVLLLGDELSCSALTTTTRPDILPREQCTLLLVPPSNVVREEVASHTEQPLFCADFGLNVRRGRRRIGTHLSFSIRPSGTRKSIGSSQTHPRSNGLTGWAAANGSNDGSSSGGGREEVDTGEVGSTVSSVTGTADRPSSSSDADADATRTKGGDEPRERSTLPIPHHVAIRTRDIETSIKFYSLLDLTVEHKFRAGPARAAWLRSPSGAGIRLELIEVPPHVLNEEEGTRKRAVDVFHQEHLLGMNHLALDVTDLVERQPQGSCWVDGSSPLSDWMDRLNERSIDAFGKALRVAMRPQQKIIGNAVYELAFLYDADGCVVELLSLQSELEQEIVYDGWEPWREDTFDLGESSTGEEESSVTDEM